LQVGSDEAIEKLSQSYRRALPLLNYLKVRLKYDTVRWLRTYGSKDDIIFSTRIKTFDRVHDKLVRKAHEISAQPDVIDIATTGGGILDDLIGIRFICFDPYRIYNLVSYFLVTERVVTSNREFYLSSKANKDHPLSRFLRSHGFKAVTKPDREYEDINFILRFSHPIDKYFGSGTESFRSLAQESEHPPTDEKLVALNTLFDRLKDDPVLLSAIPRMPIECQIVTATQHIYNRTQRPHYEYILQAKDGEPTLAAAELSDLTERLDLLKLMLLATDQNVYSIHKKLGIQYESSLRIDPGNLFSLRGRLPSDILEFNATLEKINNDILPVVIGPLEKGIPRLRALQNMLREIAGMNEKIAARSRTQGDIAAHDLLSIADFDDISHPVMVFWAFQRAILLMFCIILLYGKDKAVVDKMLSAIKTGADGASGTSRFADLDIAIARIFEKLEHLDHAIHHKLLLGPSAIEGWRDGYFSEAIFCDPLVQWRYATFLYSRREYLNALQEMRVGAAVQERLAEWKAKGRAVDFAVPPPVMFVRRSVEYELCAEIAGLRFNVATVAGMLDMCSTVLAHYEDWNAKLAMVFEQAEDLAERVRALCFQILFRLCAVTAYGPEGGIVAVRAEFGKRFAQADAAITSHQQSSVRDRTWWNLASAAMGHDSVGSLERFSGRITEVVHHPLERRSFEQACERLIRTWMPAGRTVEERGDFTANILALLKDQTDRIAKSEAFGLQATKQIEQVSHLLKEMQAEMRSDGRISQKEQIRKRLASVAGDTVGNIAVDTAVAGIRSILGI
jgi:hypothetical protein